MMLFIKLVDRAVLRVVNNTYLEEIYAPRAVAFYYCGDDESLALAKKSTELMLKVARDLYGRDLDGDSNDQKLFTREEAEAEARAIDPTFTSEMVRLGLTLLAEEFAVFHLTQRDEQQVSAKAFRPAPRIFELGDNAWDEQIRRSLSMEKTWEQNQSQSEDALLPPFSAAGLEGYSAQPDNRKIFLVHGHAEEPEKSVATFLRAVGLEVIILHEQVNQGQTIIEKLENNADVGFAVALLTPDDVGGSALHPNGTHRRARQNVILELGYFMGKLGRNKVCCLFVEGVEVPSDYLGVLYVPYDRKGDWRWKLAKELSAAEIEVDSQKLSTVQELDGMKDIFRAFFAPKNK